MLLPASCPPRRRHSSPAQAISKPPSRRALLPSPLSSRRRPARSSSRSPASSAPLWASSASSYSHVAAADATVPAHRSPPGTPWRRAAPRYHTGSRRRRRRASARRTSSRTLIRRSSTARADHVGLTGATSRRSSRPARARADGGSRGRPCRTRASRASPPRSQRRCGRLTSTDRICDRASGPNGTTRSPTPVRNRRVLLVGPRPSRHGGPRCVQRSGRADHQITVPQSHLDFRADTRATRAMSWTPAVE